MSVGLRQEIRTYSPGSPARAAARRESPVKAANDAVDIDAARLPKRRIPVTASGLRAGLKALDIVAAVLISWGILTLSGTSLLSATVYQIMPFAMIPVAGAWGLRAASAYEMGFNKSIIDHLLSAANGAGWPLSLLGLATFMIYPGTQSAWPILAMILTWFAQVAIHAVAVSINQPLTRAGWISENVIIVGATPNARRLIQRNAKTRELNIVGIFDDRLSRAPVSIADTPLLGQVDDLLSWDRLPEIDRIVVTVTSDARERVKDLVDRLRILPQRVVLLLDLDGFDAESESLAKIAHSPAAYVSGSPRDTRRAVSKRVFDIALASLFLILSAPILLLLAVAVKLESDGPVFFRQRRHGFNNQIIRVWKFRSMRDDPDAAEHMQTQATADDPRITRVGRFIRSTSLDELPQLINVLKGEMSLVGPRPHAVGMTSEEQSVYNIVGDYAHRHRVKPGITGWAQVNGSRDPVHTKALVRERVRLDMEYVNRSSFWLDCYIVLVTLPCLLGDARKVR